ncbi:MAG: hypothetical protein CSA50_04810 [Gammaproteobacteria bacterium]|nr:MAG: hypothetical protein CSA50_04810 [Gammaproteobacteria bacterium]
MELWLGSIQKTTKKELIQTTTRSNKNHSLQDTTILNQPLPWHQDEWLMVDASFDTANQDAVNQTKLTEFLRQQFSFSQCQLEKIA